MKKLTKEQVKNFVKENRWAIINFAVGSGLTFLSAEMARKEMIHQLTKGSRGEIRMHLDKLMKESRGAYTYCTSDDNKFTIKQLGEIGNEMIEYMNTNLNHGLTPDTELTGAIFLTKK